MIRSIASSARAPLMALAATVAWFAAATAAAAPVPWQPLDLETVPAALQPAARTLCEEGPRNAVLNWMQLGKDAFSVQEYRFASMCFDQAIAGIEQVYVNSPAAAKARSLWHEEKSKDFKGEPYERAMAYYYRGLLYILVEGEYDNARAAFRAGQLQDAFAEEEQNRCDFAMLYFLDGWCSQRLGDDAQAQEAYTYVRRLRPGFEPPPAAATALVVVEAGTAPRKVADGVGHSRLVYRRGRAFTEQSAVLELSAGARHSGAVAEDLYWQAATRGGRQVDEVLEGKLVFRQGGEALANTANSVGDVLMDQANNAGSMSSAGQVASGIGVVAGILAHNAKPHADVRYWKNLPDRVFAFAVTAPASTRAAVSFRAADGTGVPGLSCTGELRPARAVAASQLLVLIARPQLYSENLVPNDKPWIQPLARR